MCAPDVGNVGSRASWLCLLYPQRLGLHWASRSQPGPQQALAASFHRVIVAPQL